MFSINKGAQDLIKSLDQLYDYSMNSGRLALAGRIEHVRLLTIVLRNQILCNCVMSHHYFEILLLWIYLQLYILINNDN
jgi:hypothetical protein